MDLVNSAPRKWRVVFRWSLPSQCESALLRATFGFFRLTKGCLSEGSALAEVARPIQEAQDGANFVSPAQAGRAARLCFMSV